MELYRLYEVDETAWLDRMSLLAKEGRVDELDCHNLSEYLLDMANRDRREALSRLSALLTLLLLWDYQPQRRSRSRQASILRQKQELADLLDSQTLTAWSAENLPRMYQRAIEIVAIETGIAEKTFSPKCTYTLDDLLSKE